MGEVSVQQDSAWPVSARQSPQLVPKSGRHLPVNSARQTSGQDTWISPGPVLENNFSSPSPWPTNSPATSTASSWPPSTMSPSVSQAIPTAGVSVGEGGSRGTTSLASVLPAEVELVVAAAAAAAAPTWPPASPPFG